MSAEAAAPDASALKMKSSAAATMTRRRPQTSANRPARNAPTAQPGLAQIESALKSVLCAVDYAAVVAEHEAADSGDTHDRGYQPQVDICIAIVDQSVLPFRNTRLAERMPVARVGEIACFIRKDGW
jgi:hypothetical protein